MTDPRILSAAHVNAILNVVLIAPTHPAHADNYSSDKLRAHAIVVHDMAGTLNGTSTWFAMGKQQRQEANNRVWAQTKQVGVPPPAFVSSAHAGVGGSKYETGLCAVHTYVRARAVAYHAGGRLKNNNASIMRHGANPNLYTIGIEHETGARDTVAQLMTSAVLVVAYATLHGFEINEHTIVPHSKLANTACPSNFNVGNLIEMSQRMLRMCRESKHLNAVLESLRLKRV